ncbi:fasciclin domain-containing protein [Novosphingobium sp.]|uniref:fasciclin domain-containing protein n=1 Tax=Novosphingobium sp. TaxID=1874826 RepID=UPI0025F61362|nr:fasciclin domain-containing protein [Novosphingobium sp.]
MQKTIIILAAASALALAACTDKETSSADPSTQTVAGANDSVSALLAKAGDMKLLTGAMAATGMDGVFSGKGDYTVLAPTDAAFSALGDKGATLSDPEQKAALAAILRDHILPGTLTTADIGRAIDASSGRSVTMRTVGSGSITFARDSQGIIATSADGVKGKITGEGTVGSNGAVLPIDTLLKKV